MKSVMLVDDHELVRAGIKRLLTDIPSVKVIAEAANGEDAIVKARKCNPDVILMDIRMPGIGGLEAATRIIARDKKVAIIGLSSLNDDLHAAKLLRIGAKGYLTKKADTSEMAEALKRILAGEIYISREIAKNLAASLAIDNLHSSPFAKLTERELQVTQMITSGHRAKEIADILSISSKTINAHKYRIFEKVGVTNDVELTLCAVKYELIDPSELV